MSTLLLRLAGPLQAWGTESRFNTRQTGRAPSKSGVIGLLAAALGWRRDADLSELRALLYGVRTDQEGNLLRDYQTVRVPGAKNSDITYRYYLSDAVFLVGLESADDALLRKLDAALRAPAWPLFLGRRSCPPTLPLALGLREVELERALREEPWQVSDWHRKGWERRHPNEAPALTLLLDEPDPRPDAAVVRDNPISFDQRRREYGFRAVTGRGTVTPPDCLARLPDVTEHDAFSEVAGT
ncbi:MAG: type I-E CRISPR-associated protein Cas5/CasD [Oscillospiraceae bacterium]|nr:type I-E CRISPR-associated protein Cas5/CasD [Oscillospiraceae bacterium]